MTPQEQHVLAGYRDLILDYEEAKRRTSVLWNQLQRQREHLAEHHYPTEATVIGGGKKAVGILKSRDYVIYPGGDVRA